jgi:AcrR family transcriptional regulator
MSCLELRKQERHDRILKNALALFSAYSYSGTSMDAIATAANISKPTLYQYFGNKEGLFSVVCEKAADEILEPFQISNSSKLEGRGRQFCGTLPLFPGTPGIRFTG